MPPKGGVGRATFRVRAVSALGGEAVAASERGVEGVDGQGRRSRRRWGDEVGVAESLAIGAGDTAC